MRDLGEKISDYQSIWNYWDGKTENKFSFYEFPEQNFEITTRFNHLDM